MMNFAHEDNVLALSDDAYSAYAYLRKRGVDKFTALLLVDGDL